VYRVVTYPDAVDQVDALPGTALKFYAQALDVLRLVPENGRPFNVERPHGMREVVFGPDGEGSVVYILLADQREVHITLVQWIDLGA
jgi:hypothetical protein